MADEIILTTPTQLKALLVEAVSIALKYHQPSAPSSHTSVATPPVLNAAQVKEMTGWADGTFYHKVREMPEGVVIRGKSKRLLFDTAKFMQWLQTPVQP